MNEPPSQKRKLRVYFPEVEAGFGHIMTCRAVREIFEKKYGDEFEVITNDFYKSSDNKKLSRYGQVLINSVKRYTSHPKYGVFAGIVCEVFGRSSVFAIMNFPAPGSVGEGIKHLKEIDADVVFSTHWATNYYAMRIKGKRPYSVLYCPDAILNPLFSIKSDLTLISTFPGYRKALKKHRYNSDNLKLVPFCLRNKAFEISTDRAALREKLGIKKKQFMLVLTEGGYGRGKMSQIVKLLLEKNLPMTIVAIAGKNEELYQKMKEYKVPSNTTYIPMAFCENILEYLSCADLFCGKAGNMLAEPTFFGTPSLISGESSIIEINIAKFYCNSIACATLENNPKKAADKIENYVRNTYLLLPYAKQANMHHDYFGAEVAADLLYQSIKAKFGI